MLDELSVQELELRIILAKAALKWLKSDDLMLRDPRYAPLVPERIKQYTQEFNELVTARNRKLEAEERVRVGLKPARMNTKVLGG